MRTTPPLLALTACSLAAVAPPSSALAQAVPDGRVASARVAPDTVRFGDRFELRLELTVPSGRTAYVPDLLAGTDSVESLAPVGWTVEETVGATTTVRVAYPLIAYQVGEVPIPPVEVLFAEPPSGEVGGGGRSGAGAAPPTAAAVLSERALTPAAAARATRRTVEGQRVWVGSILSLQDVSEGIRPRPADDVVGSSWSPALLLSALTFASLLVGVTVASGRDWLAARGRGGVGAAPSPVDPIAEARAAALAELDRLLAGGPSGDAEVEAFYAASSSAVRRYVEHLDPSWSNAYTSSELMAGLSKREPAAREGGGALDALVREMRVAETVKFGRLRPDGAEALEHGHVLRHWVASS